MDNAEVQQKLQQLAQLYKEKKYSEALALVKTIEPGLRRDKRIVWLCAGCLAGLRRFEEARALAERLKGQFPDGRAEKLAAWLESQKAAGAPAGQPPSPAAAKAATVPAPAAARKPAQRWTRSKGVWIGLTIAVVVPAGAALFRSQLLRRMAPSGHMVEFSGAEAPVPARIIQFPADRAVGRLKIRNPGETEWTALGDARGATAVPEGKEALLRVFHNQGDPSLFQSMERGAIQGLDLSLADINDEQLSQILSQAPSLTELYLPGRASYGSGPRISEAVLGQLAGLRSLRALALPANVGDEGLAAVVRVKSLQSLDFSDNDKITPQQLARLSDLPHLQKVVLREAKISAEHLRALEGVRALRTLELPRDATDDVLAGLANLKSLEALDLSGQSKITGTALAHLSGLTALRDLQLGKGMKAQDADFAALASLKSLRRLSLPLCVGDEGLKHLAGLKSLETLDLAGCRKISDAGMAPLQNLASLRFLDLSETSLTGAGLEALARIRSLEELELKLSKVTDAGLAYLKNARHLKKINLGGCPIGDEGFAYLCAVPSLERLYVWNTKIDSAGLAPIGNLGALRRLGLADTAVGDEAAPYLARLKSLEYLNLENTPITAAGLAPLADLPSLRELSIADTNIGDEAAPALARFRSLRQLNLQDALITRNGVAVLERQLGQCRWPDVPSIHGGPLALQFPPDRSLGTLRAPSTGRGWRRISDARGAVTVPETMRLRLDFDKDVFAASLSPQDLSGLKSVKVVSFSETSATNQDLERIVPCLTGVEELVLAPSIDDEGLACLKGLPSLRVLNLNNTQITGPGLMRLKEIQSLAMVFLLRSKAQLSFVNELKASMPNCRVFYQPERPQEPPKVEAKAGEATTQKRGQAKSSAAQARPAAKASAAQGSARVPRFPADRSLGALKIRDAGQENLGRWADLSEARGEVSVPPGKELRLEVQAKDLPPDFFSTLGPNDIQALAFLNPEADDRVFDLIQGLTGLERLILSDTRITDQGLAKLAALKSLKTLQLNGTKLSDAGLASLKEMKSLETLQLQDTQATPQGIEELKKALPNCQINRGQGNRRPK